MNNVIELHPIKGEARVDTRILAGEQYAAGSLALIGRAA
jgi:hypothetical protein